MTLNELMHDLAEIERKMDLLTTEHDQILNMLSDVLIALGEDILENDPEDIDDE